MTFAYNGLIEQFLTKKIGNTFPCTYVYVIVANDTKNWEPIYLLLPDSKFGYIGVGLFFKYNANWFPVYVSKF